MRSICFGFFATLLLTSLASLAQAQSIIPQPPFDRTYSNANHTRGFFFKAPTDFIITSIQVPDEAQHGLQNVAIINMGDVASPTGTVTPTELVFFQTGVPSATPIPCNVHIKKDDMVCILGTCGDATMMHNSYGSGGFASNVLGFPVTLNRLNHQFNLVTSGGLGAISAGTSPLSRVFVTVTPPSGLFADFSADVTAGSGPLRVQFTDQTFTSDPGGVTSWAWDLTGDTRVDATIQNPIWTYPTQGRTVSYDVTLDVTDATHPPAKTTKRDFITVDPPPVADFDATPTSGAVLPGGPPLIVNFTDLSIGATAWAWDLTGDTVVDSTVQNPVYPYTTGGSYSVTLSVTGVGGNDRITKNNFIYVSDVMMAVVPDGLATTTGNSSTSWPWNYTNVNGIRTQYCYDTSNFPGVTGPIMIRQLRWRANQTAGSWTGRSYDNVVIDLSSAAFDHASLDTTFANNHGPDRTNVFTGTVTIDPVTANTTPGVWYVTVRFQTPFLYDPTVGDDLLVDITIPTSHVGGTSFAMDVQTTGSASSRVYRTAGATNPVGIFSTNFGPVMEVGYLPAVGLFPNFDADVTIGAAPLRVQFSDTTYTSDPGGVLTWAWDLTGDTRVDATIQNPIWTYPTQGRTVSYDVSLDVTDATHPPATEVKRGFIVVDPPPVADFDATPTLGAVPLRVQFNDLSIGATAWAWDFNNNSVVDSTIQNPIWNYTTGGVYTVRLDVTGVGGADFVVKTDYIVVVGATPNTLSAEILQYQFNEVRTDQVFNSASTTLAPPLGTVTGATGPWHADSGRYGFKGNEAGFGCLAGGSMARVDSGWAVDLQGSFTIQWWQRLSQPMTTALPYFFGNGTFRCFTNGAAGMNLLFRGTPIGDVRSSVDVQTGMSGIWQHVALAVDDAAGSAACYFDGVLDAGSVTSFTPNSFAYSDPRNFLVAGSGTSNPATSHYDMDDFRFYGNARSAAQILADMRREIATTSPFDVGCAGTAGVPLLMGNSAPSAGLGTFGLNLSSAEPNIPGVLVLGAAATQLMSTTPLPWSLDFFYGPAPGCNLHVDLALAVGLITDASGAVALPLPIPAGVSGAHIYAQALLVGTRGAVSAGLDINIGN